jgi:acyl-CoA synthetase (AMP-forming)/AMP-acid ligase II
VRGAAALLPRLLAGRQDPWVAVARWAADRPDAPAISDAERTWTYRELHREITTLAAGLAGRGVAAGERVPVVYENRVEALIAQAALTERGAVCAAVSPHLTDAELAPHVAENRWIVCAPDRSIAGRATVLPFPPGDWEALHAPARRRDPLARILGRRSGADLILHTSGTGGRPKGARLSTAAWSPGTAFALADRLDLPLGVVLWTPCPLYHAAPQLLLGLVFLLGGHLVVTQRFDAAALERARVLGATHAFLVPTLLGRLVDLPDPLPRFRGLVSSGAPLRTPLKLRLAERFGPVVYDLYGATELGVVALATPADLAVDPRTVGRPLHGVEVRIVDDAGQPAAAGDPGEIEVRSSMAMLGYEQGSEETSPWRTVGDVGCLDANGLLRVVDRRKDIVITGGVNVFPGEVEEVLEAHPAVARAGVIGVPDPEWGEAVVAFVVRKGPVEAEELAAHCAAHLARFKRPKQFRFAESLPISPTGKLLRRVLSAEAAC